ncbi:MAG: hypothetical protein ACTHMI_13970 [Mucilaginibacter sp.]
MSKTENPILAHLANVETWERQLDEHLLLQYEPEAIAAEADRDRIFYQTNEMLAEIANAFITHGRFKDHFDTSKCSTFPFGQYLLIRSEKMDVTINWGVEYNDFYLEAYLSHAENIRFMTDDFWQNLLQLKDLGEFSLAGDGGLSSEQRPYFENKTSAVFQLIRTFMLNQAERMHAGDYGTQWEYPTLVIKWPMDDDWTSLLTKAATAFKLLYTLNYQLWKVSDLADKKQKRKL